jgi:NAD(P)H dehydrogenase (quinone)
VSGLIAVTGATGELGGRVARRLASLGVEQRLVVRDPARAPDLPGAEVVGGGAYGDPAMTEALRGARTLYLVSAAEDADRIALHTAAVDAAVDAGVERIVYASFLRAAPDSTFTFARDHWATEEHIKATGVKYTFLRNSEYLDWVPMLAGPDGVIRGPADEGRIAWVARDDSADAAVPVLTSSDGEHDGRTYDLTGPESHTFRWAAEQLSRAAGRPVVFEDETLEQAYASRAGADAEPFEVDGWVTSYVAVATGELDVVSDDVERLTGRRGMTLPEFLERYPESIAHLRGGVSPQSNPG